MPEFLELLPPGLALAKMLSHLPQGGKSSEDVYTGSAVGRVTACAVCSPERLPAFNRSTVDGYAVRAVDTHGASETIPMYLQLVGEVPMGRSPQFKITTAQASLIHTGGMLPEGADAVVMLEYTQTARPGEIEVMRAVAGGENVLCAGEDVEIGDEIIPAGARLRPAEIGGLMSLGIEHVLVTRQPRVAILSSGDEVVPPQQKPQMGQVRDVNSFSLAALVEQNGAIAERRGIIPDSREALVRAVRSAWQDYDLVVITAGSSASARDLTADVIDELGEPGVLVHGVNVKPGKPTILAVCDGKPVIGLPGNPVSALVIAQLFVTPVIEHLSGLTGRPARPAVTASMAINVASQAGREDWLPVRLLPSEQGLKVEPVFYKSNLIFNLVRADGLAYIPADATGVDVGETVEVFLM
jgi:molybdopterin molybdotransferase